MVIAYLDCQGQGSRHVIQVNEKSYQP
jgi:hypothetical protein